MSNKLSTLLKIPTLECDAISYEEIYDDFIQYAGGIRLTDKFSVPNKKDNADYLFYLEDREIILELKQVTKYEKYNSIDEYFTKELKKGKLNKFRRIGGDKIEISPDSLPKSEWNRFYKRFRSSITTNLNKASSQIKDTESFISPPIKRRFKGVILINTNDYNLSTDLFFRLIEWKVKKEWKIGKYSSIDFVSCTTIDMYKKGQSPLYARHIVRTIENSLLVSAVTYLYEKWLHYVSHALNMTVSKIENEELLEKAQFDLATPFQGKILLNESP